jgi:uncharacterized heparinase superfamily protein
MTRLSLAEHASLARLVIDRSRRAVAANMLQSRLLRWRYGAPIADQLLIVPQDLRTADPSVWSEINLGHFGLAGAVAVLDQCSPFDLKPPSESWARELHGFGWLRHLDAAQSDAAKAKALEFILDWISRNRNRSGVAWEPAVIGRRLISWISHATMLLEGIPPKSYDRIAESLGGQMVHLSAAWRNAADGYPRMVALTALVLADLCVANHDRQLAETEALFAAEIERQILPDGGHCSRNPGLLVELLLDFLPLGQCFAARNREPPKALPRAISRMLPMVRFMRLGDGALARFNGMGTPQPDALATVLAYDDRPGDVLASAGASRYLRIERGEAVLIVDGGSPPPLRLAGEAHAGCLALEMSVGTRALLVNGGAPGPVDDQWRSASRATASHNTLCLDAKSSSRLVRNRLLESVVGAPPIRFPAKVTHTTAQRDGGVAVDLQHDGYARAHGLLHSRHLFLHENGGQLDGIDRLSAVQGESRLARELPFAIHFHLSPDVVCTPGQGTNAADLEPGDGSIWRFEAQGATLAFEDSVYYADFSGPRRTLQLVLRAACFGRSEVRWSVSRTRVSTKVAATSRPLPPPLPRSKA